MARSVSEGIISGFKNYSELQNQAYQRRNEQQQALINRAKLRQQGYDIQGNNLVEVPTQPLPPGFVRVAGQVERDPSYLNEKEKAQMQATQQWGSLFNPVTGGTTSPEAGVTPIAANVNPSELLNKLNPQVRSLIKGIVNYEIDPTRSSSIRNNQRMQLISLAKMYDPTYDMTQFPARSAYREAISSGKIGANVRSFNTAMQHLSELYGASKQVPSSSIRFLESGQRTFAKQFAGASPAALGMAKEDAAISAVAGELANIFKNSGGTDQEIDKWFKAYDPNSTKEAKQQFIRTGIDLMKGRLGAISSDYQRVMGKPNPQALISPESEQAIMDIYGQNQMNEKQNGVIYVDSKGNRAIVYPDGSYKEIQ